MTELIPQVKGGDKVILSCTDWERRGYKDKNTLVAEVMNTSGWLPIVYIRPEDNGLSPSSHETYTGEIVERSLKGILCGKCRQRKIYHDTKEEYFCPWCDDD